VVCGLVRERGKGEGYIDGVSGRRQRRLREVTFDVCSTGRSTLIDIVLML
jgi:hypothetical protein